MKKSEAIALYKTLRPAVTVRKAIPNVSVGADRNADTELVIHKSVDMARKDPKILEFQKQADTLLIISKMTGIPIQNTQAYGRFTRFIETSELKKAMTESDAASWIPTTLSGDFYDRVQIALKVAALFGEITVPRFPFEVGRKNAFGTARLKAEATDPTTTKPTAGKMTMTGATIIDRTDYSYEAEEDVIFALAQTIRDDAINACARAIEDAIINGDTTAQHMDSDVTSAEDARKAWKGLRKHAIANGYTTSLSTFNGDNLIQMRTNMGKYGADFTNLAWIIGTMVAGKMVNLKDSSGNRLYVELGTPGTQFSQVLPGQCGQFSSSPVILSEFAREDLGASGWYNGSITTRGTVLLVRKDCFTRGTLRKIMIETWRDVSAQVTRLVVSTRMDFQPKYAIATNHIVDCGINVTV
jgi:HK97 family phage major capsid protein